MGKRVSSVHGSRGTKSKKILASLMVLAATGIAGVGATTSAFTDSATATTEVTAGTINLTANSTKTATYNLGTNTKWKPGMTQTATITLNNTGTLPITVNMATTNTGSTTGLANKLTATITNTTPTTPTTLQTSIIMKNAAFSNLSIPAGGTAALKVDVTWPTGSNDNDFAGKTDTVTFTFSATNS